MRRQERELKNKETVVAMLKHVSVGRMATVNRQGIPVIKPVNFLYLEGKIYIHSSTQGEKMEDIHRGSPVCFEVDDPIAYLTAKGPACRSSYYYRSIIMKGKALLVTDRNKKMIVLERLMEKYQSEGGYEGISEDVLKKTAVIEIIPYEITGKENLG